MEERLSPGIMELQAKIDEATKSLEESHRKALRMVRTLKDKMNALELNISEKGSAKTKEDLDELNSAIDKLNRLTDYLITESAKAWEEYEKFEHGCNVREHKPADMDGLKAICKGAEELAKDLLCYSLGHFKRKSE